MHILVGGASADQLVFLAARRVSVKDGVGGTTTRAPGHLYRRMRSGRSAAGILQHVKLHPSESVEEGRVWPNGSSQPPRQTQLLKEPCVH